MKYLIENKPLSFYKNAVAILDDNYAAYIIPKCACTTCALMHFKYENVILEDDYTNRHLGNVWNIYYNYQKRYDNVKNSHKLIAIYRDPIERIISAKNVLNNKDISFIDYIDNVIETITSCDIKDINHHLVPQSYFYNKENVNFFININDFNNWLIANTNIIPFYSNKTKDKINNIDYIYNYEKEIKEFYSDDYKLISSLTV